MRWETARLPNSHHVKVLLHIRGDFPLDGVGRDVVARAKWLVFKILPREAVIGLIPDGEMWSHNKKYLNSIETTDYEAQHCGLQVATTGGTQAVRWKSVHISPRIKCT